MSYKDKNKSKGEHGYSNRRGLDAIASLFGGLTGKAAKKLRERKEKNKPKDK